MVSKYIKLWEYVKIHCVTTLELTFDEITNILGFEIDHSFLKYKKELAEFGWAVKKISMKAQTVAFEKLPKADTLVLYVHGKGGTAEEAEHYKSLFPNCDVAGLDYTAQSPWEAAEEFPRLFDALAQGYSRVILVANSIGAYFSMGALPQERLEKAWFISPIVDMEGLINNMMGWANVTEAQLEDAGTIETEFGETLSWEYLCYVRSHPLRWTVPTNILYGGQDNLTDRETIAAFATAHGASLTVMDGGEHWFHTPEQMKFLDDWIIHCTHDPG